MEGSKSLSKKLLSILGVHCSCFAAISIFLNSVALSQLHGRVVLRFQILIRRKNLLAEECKIFIYALPETFDNPTGVLTNVKH